MRRTHDDTCNTCRGEQTDTNGTHLLKRHQANAQHHHDNGGNDDVFKDFHAGKVPARIQVVGRMNIEFVEPIVKECFHYFNDKPPHGEYQQNVVDAH